MVGNFKSNNSPSRATIRSGQIHFQIKIVLSLLCQIHECSQMKVPRHLGYWRSCAASWWCRSCCDGVSLYNLSRCLWHVMALVHLPCIVRVVDAYCAWGPLAHICRTMSSWSLASLHEFMSLEPETVDKDVKRWLERNYQPSLEFICQYL